MASVRNPHPTTAISDREGRVFQMTWIDWMAIGLVLVYFIGGPVKKMLAERSIAIRI